MPETPKTTGQRDRSTWAFRIASLAGRGLAIAALAWVGISTGAAITTLFSGEVVRQPLENASNKFPKFTPVAAELLRGQWEFDGVPVGIELHQVAENEVEQIFAQPPVGAKAETSITADQSGLLGLMRARLPLLKKQANLSIHGTDSASFRVRIFSRSTTEILGGYVAVPRGDGLWMVFAVRGLAHSTTAAGKSLPLMTLPNTAKQLATRHGLDGELQCELITLGCRFEHAWDLWSRAGWTAEALPTAAAQGDSFLLKRGAEVVQVHGLGTAKGTGPQYLLLVRGTVPSKSN